MHIKEVCTFFEPFKSAKPAARAKIISYGFVKRYAKGTMLFWERDTVNRIFFVVKGYVALHKTNNNQDKKIVFVYGPGTLLNEVILAKPTSSISCETLSEATILSFSRSQFTEIMQEDFGFTAYVLNSLASKVRRLYHQLGNTSNTMHLSRRLAAKLWKLGKDFGKERDGRTMIDFELSITFLADMLGSKRETVSRALKKLTAEGLVIIEKNHFYLTDLDKLKVLVKNKNS